MGTPWAYFDFGNCIDCGRAVLAFAFYLYPGSISIQALLIAIYWFRLLEVSVSENLMRELLPITRLAEGLIPSSIVCCVAVFAAAHSKWVMDKLPLWPDTFYGTFSLLITASLPDVDSSDFNLLFAFFAVMSFSVFFLNLFIGVIGENYTVERENSNVSMLRKKTGLCQTFMMRAMLLPTWLFNRCGRQTAPFVCLAVMVYTAVATCAERSWMPPVPYPVLVYVVSQSVALLACYQDGEGTWSDPGDKKDRGPNDEVCEPLEVQPLEVRHRYLWFCTPSVTVTPSEEDKLKDALSKLGDELDELKEAMEASSYPLVPRTETVAQVAVKEGGPGSTRAPL